MQNSNEERIEQAREALMENIRYLVKYWATAPVETTTDRLEGLAFSTLVLLDGGNGNSLGFKVIPLQEEDEEPLEDIDISGCLHEYFYKR